MEYKKNDRVTLTIEDMSTAGEGIGRADGFTLFVKDAVPGDTVEAKIMKCRKNYAYARLEKVLTPSPFRVEPKCACHRQCGGCQLQALSYEKQLEYKQSKIYNALIRIGGFSREYIEEKIEPIIGMEMPFHYRNKAQYPVGTDRDGNVIAGFYAGRTHTIIPNTECGLGVLENREILEIILKHMRRCHIPAYDEATGKGLVRHVLIRKGFASGEIMVCLVVNQTFRRGLAEFIPEQDDLLKELAMVKGMASVSVSINTERTNVIMGKEIYTLWGSPVISDTIHVRDMREEGYPFTGKELTFHISPLSFYQVNPVQTEKLYSLALEYAGLTGAETVWDLYCGIGTISLFLAGSAKKVYGVEAIPQAVEDARENARKNGIGNAEFFVGKAEEVLPDFYGNAEEGEDMLHPDVIVVDPPRKGCDEACLDTILKMRPERIIYVSCDPATLARDLKVLCGGGYEIVKVRGVDQFGMTVHVETVVQLSQRKPDKAMREGSNRPRTGSLALEG
ncbi:MAG: 23S rRNA (uracil(1939)-C(5))-methyltransferase RlmD [Lachnospiraceae bacterium]|nr:23S rRNA (uracil(1939)-C(5))-methyltransferase RlmD [Butyrivibrio sp.]MCM1343056.1 23S rRNA (uracil(1939)-C(5))-methyltransferase RlmD [Muribaculaceae bacterium]MCM1410377.1 23S rRNA (uracil(1939)-C(5))-methyltransferase RlmD [Lachnospiraceae bacterium]